MEFKHVKFLQASNLLRHGVLPLCILVLIVENDGMSDALRDQYAIFLPQRYRSISLVPRHTRFCSVLPSPNCTVDVVAPTDAPNGPTMVLDNLLSPSIVVTSSAVFNNFIADVSGQFERDILLQY